MGTAMRLSPRLPAALALVVAIAIAGCSRDESSSTDPNANVVVQTTVVVVTSVVEVAPPTTSPVPIATPPPATQPPATQPSAKPSPQSAPVAEQEATLPQRGSSGDVAPGSGDTAARMIDTLNRYFAAVQAGDYQGAFLMLYDQPPYAEYVDYWAEKVDSFTYAVVGCEGDNMEGYCTYEIYVTYSDMASPDYAGKCIGERTRIYLDGIEGGWALGAQERLAGLTC